MNYWELNYNTYNSLAEDYFERLNKYDNYYRIVGEKICEMIFEYLYNKSPKNDFEIINVLELGCGPGAILQALKSYRNVSSYAIDISEKMAYFARRSNPDTKVLVKNVLDVYKLNNYFHTNIDGKLDIIIMAAFIHLFPYEDAQRLLIKVKTWLKPSGIIYIDTTKEKEFRDGKVVIKKSFNRDEMLHFRTDWTSESFNVFLKECGYDIVKQIEHRANNTGRIWLRTIIKPK